MYTVYLVRDTSLNPPSYLAFLADGEDKVLAETAYTSEKYSEAVLHASILFDFTIKKYKKNVACYIESSFDSPAITAYSKNEFCAKKGSSHTLFQSVLDEYYTLLLEFTPEKAFETVVNTRLLTPTQQEKLKQFISLAGKV